MNENAYFYVLDEGANSRQSVGLLLVMERKYEGLLFYCPSFSVFWSAIENNLPQQEVVIKRPSFGPATLQEIYHMGYLNLVQGIVEYKKGKEVNILFNP